MKKKETSIANRIFVISLCTLLSLYALSMIGTLLWGFMTSLKNPMEMEGKNPNWLGFPVLDSNALVNSVEHFFKFKNYTAIFDAYSGLGDYETLDLRNQILGAAANTTTYYTWWGASEIKPMGSDGLSQWLILFLGQTGYDFLIIILNTIIYTAIGSILHTVIPAIVAYAVVKYDNPVAKVITGAALFAMTTPIVGSQASMLAMLRNIGLYDTIWGYLLQKAGFGGMYFFVFCAFYESIPDSFSEAAEIDGASQFYVLIKIIIPLSVKMLSTVFVIQFIHFWNDYQTANLYMPHYPTIAYFVWKMTQVSQLKEATLQIATTMVLAMPILIAFIFLKDKLMGNVTMGGLKQ